MLTETVKMPVTEAYYSQMEMHISTVSKYISLGREYNKHILDPSRKNGVMNQGRSRKRSSQRKWTACEYHVQYIKYVSHKTVKISCSTRQFIVFPFCIPHIKLHGVRILRKHYYIQLYPKLGNVKCAIWRIPCACVPCTNILENTSAPGVDHAKQVCYQPVVDCT